MQCSYRVRLVVGVVLAWFVASFALAQTFDGAARTVTVTPSGGDDTAALRSAFDICQSVGPGCTVQLTEGVFRTQQIEVWGFRGTFAGARMDETVVETLAPLPISPPDLDLAERFWDPGGGPVLIAFRNAHMTMRDLTVRNVAEAPTAGWTHGGFPILALSALLWFEGDDLRVGVERVAIESGPGDFFDAFSVINGVWIQSLETVPGSPVPDMEGAFTFREGRIDGQANGFTVSNVETYAVIVRDSVIAGDWAVMTSNVGRSVIEFRSNEIIGFEVAVAVLDEAGDRAPLGPSTIIVADNSIRTIGGDGAVAVSVLDEGARPTQFVIVERNRIELDGSAHAAVAGQADGLVVRDNVIVGSASVGVQVGAGPSGAPVPWLVVGNDVTGFSADDVDIEVSSEARGAVVVCLGSTTVRDAGRDSVVACD